MGVGPTDCDIYFVYQSLARLIGAHRIRHYGLLAGGARDASLARARELLEAASSVVDSEDHAATDDGPQSALAAPCPCCGDRGVDEFAYYGDASVTRPDASAPTAMADFIAYAYERTNSAGLHRELWYHAAGCHLWLVVTRCWKTDANAN